MVTHWSVTLCLLALALAGFGAALYYQWLASAWRQGADAWRDNYFRTADEASAWKPRCLSAEALADQARGERDALADRLLGAESRLDAMRRELGECKSKCLSLEDALAAARAEVRSLAGSASWVAGKLEEVLPSLRLAGEAADDVG